MKIKSIITMIALIIAQNSFGSELSMDDAISEIENCTCYRTESASALEPWELSWDSQDKLREQIEYCKCEVKIDIQKVKDPKRYIQKGTILK